MNYTTLHTFFAWISTLAIFLLAILYPLSHVSNKYNNKYFISIHTLLKKVHKPLGILVIITALIHGRFSLQHPGMNLGTLCLLLTILLAISYALKKQIGAAWKWLHKFLTLGLILFTILHIIIKN